MSALENPVINRDGQKNVPASEGSKGVSRKIIYVVVFHSHLATFDDMSVPSIAFQLEETSFSSFSGLSHPDWMPTQ